MLTSSQITQLTTRSTGPWPSAGSPAWGLRVHYIAKPNPLSGAPAGAFEIHDCAGRYLTWTTDPAVLAELIKLESQGYGTVLALLEGGAYKPAKEPRKASSFDLEGLQL
jgi:hypothetical protein